MSGLRRVIVGVSESPGSLQALRHAAGLARARDALLIPVHAWSPPGGELAERKCPAGYLHDVWQDIAVQRLATALELGLGGPPPDIDVDPTVLRGDTGRVLVQFASQPDDLLVVGAGRRGALHRALSRPVSRYCVAHARCPVLTVPQPELAELSHGLRGWALRHRGLSLPDLSQPTA